MRTTLSATALGLAAVLLSGCGGDGKDSAKAPSSPAPTAPATKPASTEANGLDGTWKPINTSPIATLKITGNTVRTTGRLACPGTVTGTGTGTGTKKPVLTLKCATENPDRKRGTLKLKPDGSALVVSWDGPAWGGLIDSLKRAG
ncbi:MAG: lipolytic enzyme [Actinoallomurus sp.]|jgi:hypothetical protein|nr:lipolytic enzyme [Actinoallomurus sp.]